MADRASLLNLIGSAEAPDGYATPSSFAVIAPPRPLDQMTLGEVLAWQDQNRNAGAKSTAAGRYQFIRATLAETAAQAGIGPDQPFNAETQDRLANHKLDRLGYQKFERGEMTVSAFADNLAGTWAGLPVLTGPERGRSKYAGDGLNAATVKPEAVMLALGADAPASFAAPEQAPAFRSAPQAQAPFRAPPGFWEETGDIAYESGIVRYFDRKFSTDSTLDPSFDPLAPENLSDAARPYWRELRYARNQSEFDFVLARAQADEVRREKLLFSDRWAPALLGALAQPETLASMVFIPGAIGIGFIGGMARVGAANLAFEAGAEAVRRGETADVTAGESVMRIGGATLFAGLAGGTIGAIGAKRAARMGREFSEEVAAVSGRGAFTTKLALGDDSLKVRSVRMPNDAPPVAQSSGVWLRRDTGEILVDDGVVSRGAAAKAWTGAGFEDDAFKNANEWREYLIRLAAAREEVGVSRMGTITPHRDIIETTGLKGQELVDALKHNRAFDQSALGALDAASEAEARRIASDGFAAWRVSNRKVLKNRFARAVHKMAPTPYKRVHQNAAAAETIDLMDQLALDGGMASLAHAAGRTTGASVAMEAKTYLWLAQRLRRAEDDAYEAYLGYASNPRALDIPINKSFRSKRATGEKAISPEEFRRRAAIAHVTGTNDGIEQVDTLASALTEFYDDFAKLGEEAGALGQYSREAAERGVRATNHMLERARAKPTSEAVEQEIATLEARLSEFEAMRDAPLMPKNEQEHYSRVWAHQAIRKYPKTIRAVLRRWFADQPFVTVWDDAAKGFKRVATDPRTIDERVDAAVAKIMGDKDPAQALVDELDEAAERAANPSGRPGFAHARRIDIPNRLLVNVKVDPSEGTGFVDLIETDMSHVASVYAQRMGAHIAFSRRFADPALNKSAADGFEDALKAAMAAEQRAFKGKPEDFAAHWGKIKRDLLMARDQVLSRVTTDPARWDNRVAGVLRDSAHLVFMGMSAISSIPDAGKITMAHGLAETQRFAFLGMDKATRASFRGLVDEARQAGALTDIALATSMKRWSEVGTDPAHMTGFERALRGGVNRYFIANGLAPLTLGMRSLTGAISAHRFIDDALAVAAGKGSPEQIEFLAQYGISPKMARAIAKERAAGRIDFDEAGKVWLANTGAWEDQAAVRAYRAALAAHIDNTILVASAADKPAMIQGVLHFKKSPMLDGLAERYGWRDAGDYWRVQSGLIGMPFQFWNFGLAAMNKIAAASIENPSSQVVGGLAMMAGLGYLALSLRTPDYTWDNMTLGDKVLRTIDQSGMAGMITDWTYTAQGAVGAATGQNVLPFGYKYGRAPTGGDAAFDILGAGPSVARNFFLGGAEGIAGGEWDRFSWAVPGRNHFLFSGVVDDAVDAANGPRRPSTPSRI